MPTMDTRSFLGIDTERRRLHRLVLGGLALAGTALAASAQSPQSPQSVQTAQTAQTTQSARAAIRQGGTVTLISLLEAVSAEPDPARRRALFVEVQRHIARDLPDLTLLAQQTFTVADRRVRNHTVGADGAAGNLAGVWLAASDA